uniref:Uncharacterized protein n=1 Tax=Pyxicephalus adspersus TaxID=30357 RepID=A0AAV2ZTP4_PYXAD|nr:TPA: hypothetical protein GDO54_004332 [Pyxicephalus adspersus]
MTKTSTSKVKEKPTSKYTVDMTLHPHYYMKIKIIKIKSHCRFSKFTLKRRLWLDPGRFWHTQQQYGSSWTSCKDRLCLEGRNVCGYMTTLQMNIIQPE